MSDNGHRFIAREGMPVLFALLAMATTAYVSLGLMSALVFLFLLLVLAFLFRDPACEVPALPLAVLSPASGTVLSVSEVEDPWLSRTAVKIRIKISPWDVHSLRSPVEGKVMDQKTSADTKRMLSKQITYWLQTDEGDDVLMTLGMYGATKFTRMSIYSGQRTGQGQRCGFLYLAGVIDVYLPANAKLVSKTGERVISGTSILGQFVHEKSASVISPQQ